MPNYTLTVNGTRRTVNAPADMPLLWALRDLLGLTGTKFGCGVGQCRACTVHVDGNATFSCQVSMSAAANHTVTTIEGLPKSGVLNAVQQAWIAEDVPQCGYCQPGQIMSATALLASNPHPTDQDIDTAMSGNICRCGTYNRIRKAIHAAAAKTGGAAR
jgi:isoquinoline 1-oxidoreductase alpha subunit